MNSITTYNYEFQRYKEHYDALMGIRGRINSQVKALIDDDTESYHVRELLRLRDFITSAMEFCGERMYANVQGIAHEMLNMKGEIERFEN